jgi:S-adenosylmethionine-diacylgycerolhomoserine-N-methlytransferase
VTEQGTHAALMDRVYRQQRHIYDLTRKFYLLGRDRMIDRLAPAPGARIVEVGCGTARNLIRIARRYPDSTLFGLDASQAMLDTAAVAVGRAGLSNRIKLASGYAEALSPASFGETAPFDNILFSYSLSMIPDWKQALDAARNALGANGQVHIVDFGDLANLARPASAALRKWLDLFHVAPREELLRALEQSAGDNARLQILPGRYAFLFSSDAESLPHFKNIVARLSQ